MEIFEDYTVKKMDTKTFATIQKREFNPELSAMSNVILDLVDFRDRVRPIANDLTLMDVARKYQRTSMEELDQEKAELMHLLDLNRKHDKSEKGYSSGEISDKSSIVEEEVAVKAEEPVAEIPEPYSAPVVDEEPSAPIVEEEVAFKAEEPVAEIPEPYSAPVVDEEPSAPVVEEEVTFKAEEPVAEIPEP